MLSLFVLVCAAVFRHRHVARIESLGDAYLNSELLPLVDSLAYDSGDTAARFFCSGISSLMSVHAARVSYDLAVESAGGLGHLRAGISLVVWHGSRRR